MKVSLYLFAILFTTVVFSQDLNINTDAKTKTEVMVLAHKPLQLQTITISTKGIKKIEDIKVKDFNKHSFLKLMTIKPRRSNIC